MEIDLVEQEELIKKICELFLISNENLKLYNTISCFRLEFSYKETKIFLSNTEQYLNKNGKYLFEIYLRKEALSNKNEQVYCDFTPFWYIYSYFKHKKFIMEYDRNRIFDYLKDLKELVDENQLIFIQTDVKNKKRYIFIRENKKEIDFSIDIDLDKDLFNVFGDEYNIIKKYKPTDL